VNEPVTVFEVVGGEAFFEALVDRFYAAVADDSLLRPMYPKDLVDAKAHLCGFLIQYWGGPTTYSDERGHPRLRMRHVPFVIGQPERDAWYQHMAAALEASDALPEVKNVMREYFDNAATAMINHVES
jgi:hemoglobin